MFCKEKEKVSEPFLKSEISLTSLAFRNDRFFLHTKSLNFEGYVKVPFHFQLVLTLYHTSQLTSA